MKGVRKLQPVWQRARSGTLTLSGLSSLAAAAWTAWGVPAGLGAAGVALLLLEYLTSEEPRR